MPQTAAEDTPSTWPEVLAYMRDYHLCNSDQRLGQAYFNALQIIWPEVAEVVRTTDADPFFANSPTDRRMQKFYDVIIPYFV